MLSAVVGLAIGAYGPAGPYCWIEQREHNPYYCGCGSRRGLSGCVSHCISTRTSVSDYQLVFWFIPSMLITMACVALFIFSITMTKKMPQLDPNASNCMAVGVVADDMLREDKLT